MKVTTITYFPDGSIYDQKDYLTPAVLSSDELAKNVLAPLVTLDAKTRRSGVSSAIGSLDLSWYGSIEGGIGCSTWFLGEKMFNTGLYLAGINSEMEQTLLDTYIGSWRSAEVVKELCGDTIPFPEVYSIPERPLMVAVNWATIDINLYSKISHFDLLLGAIFFEQVNVMQR